MNTSRRDLLKYFGIGTVIAPLASGLADVSKAAVLVEPPKIEIAAPQQANLYGLLTSAQEWGMAVEFKNQKTGEVYRFAGDTFVTNVRAHMVDVTQWGDDVKRYAHSKPTDVSWTLSGVMVGEVRQVKIR